MGEISISTKGSMGPLSVEIVALSGEQLSEQPILLSASHPRDIVRNVPQGEYAVIATRPTGETLVERVKVADRQARVVFRRHGHSPQEFLRGAAERGLVPTLDTGLARGGSLKQMSDRGEPMLGFTGTSAQTLRALIKQSGPSSDGRLDLASIVADLPARRFALRHWELRGGRWHAASLPVYALGADYLQVQVRNRQPPGKWRREAAVQAHAVALLGDGGFGPHVIVPAFREGLDLTFSADALLPESADRVTNPSAARVPVAIAVPCNPRVADLLSGLTAPSLPGAEQLWRDGLEAKYGGTEAAFELLIDKFNDPAAAMLGAHFLARFAPLRAPAGWLQNLCRLLPDIADPPLLLAMQLIGGGELNGERVTRSGIASFLQSAASRPTCLFARARALLTQGLRLYGRDWDYAEEFEASGSAIGAFLNFAADACGLEAFWGTGPASPGPDRPAPATDADGSRPVPAADSPSADAGWALTVRVEGGMFRQ